MSTPPRPNHPSRTVFPYSSPESLRGKPGGPFNYSRESPRTPADEADAIRGSPYKNPTATFSPNDGDVGHRLNRILGISCLHAGLTPDYEAGIYAPLAQVLGIYLSVYKAKTNKTESCLITCPQGVVHNLPPEPGTDNSAGSVAAPSWATEIVQQTHEQVNLDYRLHQPSDEDDVTMEDMLTVTIKAKKKELEVKNRALKKRPRVIPDFNGIVVERRVDIDVICDSNIIFTVEIKTPRKNPQNRKSAIRKLAAGQVHTQVAYIFTQNKRAGDLVPAFIVYGLYWTYAEFNNNIEFNALREPSAPPAAVARILQKLMLGSESRSAEGRTAEREPGSETQAEPELDHEMLFQESEEEAEAELVDHDMRNQESEEEAAPDPELEHETYVEQLLVAVSTLSQEEVASELSRILGENPAGILVHTWESRYATTLAAMRIQHLYSAYWCDRRLGETSKNFVHGKSIAQSIIENKIRNRERIAQLEKQVQELEAKLESATDTIAGSSAGKFPGKGSGKGKAKQGGK